MLAQVKVSKSVIKKMAEKLLGEALTETQEQWINALDRNDIHSILTGRLVKAILNGKL